MPECPPHHPPVPEVVSIAFSDAAFMAARDVGAPCLLIAEGGMRLVWANQAAAHLFDAAGYDRLQRCLLGTGAAAMRRLGDVMASGPGPSAPRLERLRFTSGPHVRNLTALCARARDLDGKAAVALAFVGAEADAAARTAWEEEPAGRPSGFAVETLSRAVAALIDPVSPGTARRTEALRRTLDAGRDGLRAALGGSETCRFGWMTDAEGALVQVDEALMRRLGLPFVHDELTTWIEQVAGVDPAGAAHLARALEDGLTFSGVDLVCPLFDGALALPLTLAGSPRFDAAHRFSGFRGFGRLDLARLAARHAPDVLPPMVEAAVRAPVGSTTTADAVSQGEEARAGEARLPSEPQDPPPLLPADAALAATAARPLGQGASEGDAADGTAAAYDHAANVVQLRPAHAAPMGRTAFPAPRSLPLPEPALAPGAGGVEGDEAPGVEATIPQGPDRKTSLTSSEHLAFQEIGRALGPGPRRGTSSPSKGGESPGAPPPPDAPKPADGDLARHAAALVEHMAAGLLVTRQKRILFANDAVREALRFDSHSELLDALALHFARIPPVDEAQPRVLLSLPCAHGGEAGFTGSLRRIPWDGQPATLWTLLADAPAPVGSPAVADPLPVLDLLGEPVTVIGLDGRILAMNDAAGALFGRVREAAPGDAFAALLPPESRAAATALLAQINADPRPGAQARGECTGRSADGSPLSLALRLTRLDGGRAALVWRDVSTERALERDLAQARQQAARVPDQEPDFLAHVSHQVRTPLNAILGFAEIMMDERFGSLGNPRYRDYLKDIHSSGTQVITLIDDLMDLSRIEAGRLDMRLGAININKVIVDCVAEAHGLAHRERVIVRTSFGARLPPVMADERSARQIVGNLLSNAIKFNEPGGQVIVSTAAGEGAVVVRIRDTGIGMSDSDIAAALEPFRQLAPTKNASGTGLGLPLTKALVGANGASLSMRSRPNEGTMVEVTFQATVPAPSRVPA